DDDRSPDVAGSPNQGEAMKNLRVLAVSGIAASIAVGAAACSSTASSTTPAPASSSGAASAAAGAAAASSPASAMSDFGPGCSSVPKTGAGSFTGMATAPVATAAS